MFYIKKILKKSFMFDQWRIFIRPNHKLFQTNNLDGFKEIKTHNGHFYADPFIFKKDNRNYIFYEDFDWAKHKGIICCMELTKEGLISKNSKVLERSYHLSFPAIFEYDNDIYMIPETLETKRIELYKADNFPISWKLEKILIDDIACVDSNIFYCKDKYWLFTCVEGKTHNTELYIFYSDNPLGGWKEHACNPVVDDVSNARLAGNIFVYNEQIIRPAQDCKIHYGYALNFNIIKELDENTYKEEKLATILPDWKKNNISTHSYNYNEDFELIDGQIPKVDMLKPFRVLKREVRKRIR